jgi:hypothetical protein
VAILWFPTATGQVLIVLRESDYVCDFNHFLCSLCWTVSSILDNIAERCLVFASFANQR